MNFDYFYNREAEGFNFLKVPEILVEGEEFQGLSAEAILLYAMLLKRAGMSYKNNWLDKQNRVFIYFTVEEIMRKRHLSKPTAIKLLDELDKKNGIGLIERVRVGLGKPNIIYVKDFLSMVQEKSVVQKFNDLTSEVKNIDSNYIDNNKSDYNKRENRLCANGLGSFQNVFLEENDRAALELLLNGQLNNYIERLSAYLKSSGKTYKDHKATILSWFYKDQGNRRCIKASNIPSLEEYDKGEHL